MLTLWDPWPPFVLRHQNVEPGAEENSSHEPGSPTPHRQASRRPPKQPQLLPIEDINITTTILTNSDNYKPEKISSSTSKKPPESLSEKG